MDLKLTFVVKIVLRFFKYRISMSLEDSFASSGIQLEKYPISIFN